MVNHLCTVTLIVSNKTPKWDIEMESAEMEVYTFYQYDLYSLKNNNMERNYVSDEGENYL